MEEDRPAPFPSASVSSAASKLTISQLSKYPPRDNKSGGHMRVLSAFLSLGVATAAFCADTTRERMTESSKVFSEIMATPDKGIPQDLLDKAACIIVLPNLKKAAFVVGGEY